MGILANISAGELLDKVSILKIKKNKIKEENKLKEIEKELSVLEEICEKNLKGYRPWGEKLNRINLIVWENVGAQWEKYKNNKYDFRCIELSKAVIINNDKRFQIKDAINKFYDSEIKEQKSYDDK